MRHNLLKKLCLFFVFVFSFSFQAIAATQVSMASVDMDGDGIDEIVRSEGEVGKTVIRVYQKIEASYFYKISEEFDVAGQLVQVPDVLDVNYDKLPDFFFTTGADSGVIYFDLAEQKFRRENQIDQMKIPDILEKERLLEEEAQQKKIESDLILKLQMEQEGALPDVAKSDSYLNKVNTNNSQTI